jgi:hypothetical protein
MKTSRYRRLLLPALVPILVMIAGARGTAADVVTDTVDAGAAIHRLLSAGLAARDSATLVGILAPDFVHPVASGDFLTRAQHIAWVVAHPPDTTIARRLADMRVRLYGTTAVVTGTVIRSRDGAEVGRNVFTDVFVKRAGRWRAVSAEETLVRSDR